MHAFQLGRHRELLPSVCWEVFSVKWLELSCLLQWVLWEYEVYLIYKLLLSFPSTLEHHQ